MENKLRVLEKEITIIKQRNLRVEADKAWEISWFRIGLIAVLTYLLATLFLFIIGAANYWIASFVPVIGYVLSTQSLPLIKKWWIKKWLEHE